VALEQRPLPIQHLPAHLQGATLVQISDMHIGNRFDWSYQIDVLQKVQAMQPDFVVYTGDFVTYETAVQFEQLSQFLRYAPLGRRGSVAILGNHDYGQGWSQTAVADEVTRLVTAAGITVLRNELVTIDGLTVGGMDDAWSPNYAPQTLTRQMPTDSAVLMLCHNPDVVDFPVWHDYQGWVLSGHTHGGQVKPPFLPPPVLPVHNKRYTAGEFDVGNGRMLYINRGLGHLWPVRFNVRPEVTLFTLQATAL
jgi:predicted MPP superfamily phosphohydrolase